MAVCRGTPPRLPEGADVARDFVAATRYHRISPLAHVALRESHPDVAAMLRADRDEAMLNHLRTSALLGGIGQTLGDIDWLVFKGPVLAEFAHPVPGLRFYKDLDLLVSAADFPAACHRLFDAGWQLLVGDDSLLGSELAGEVPLVDAHGIVMDLHWSMVVMSSVRRRFDVSAEDLLARRQQRRIGPAAVSVLSPADALVHVCQHAALIGATKLGHVLDADQLARQVKDWDDVAERAVHWGAEVQVAAVLGRAARLLGTPVPEGFDRRLGLGRAMTRVMAWVDHAWPVQSLRQDASWVRLITRALRPGPLRTAGTVLARSARGVRNRMRRRSAPPARKPATAEAINTYLARVTAATAVVPAGDTSG